MTKILLTGGTGFIGSHVLELLVREGHKVLVLKRSSSSTERIEHLRDKAVLCDIDVARMEGLFAHERPEIIIHLATYYQKQDSFDEIPTMVQTNIEFPSILLFLAKKYGVRGFVNTGTFFEYEPADGFLHESAGRRAFNFYTSTKQAFLAILKYYSRHFPIVDLKLFSPYGPRDNRKLVLFLIESLLAGREVELTKGEQELDWTYVGDIANAYLKAVDFVLARESGLEEFNIGVGDPHSVRELAKTLMTMLRKEGLVRFTRPYPPGEIMHAAADNTKARNLLKWTPSTKLEKGLKKTVEWYREAHQRK